MNISAMCHIAFTLYVHDPTFISQDGGDGGRNTDEESTEPFRELCTKPLDTL